MVAVTGASGLLGRHIVEKLVAEGVAVLALVRDPQTAFAKSVIVRQIDILDPFTIQTALEGATAVIHAAGFVSFNPRRRKEIMDVNVGGTRNVVDVCLHLGIKNLVHISSVSALGRKSGEIVTEDHSWTGLDASDYATSKYLAELEVYRGAEEGLTVGLINPSVILSGSQSHRSSATLFDYVWAENRFYTDGHLNYVDARDVSDVVYELLTQPRSGERFILTGGTIHYGEFFARLAKQWNKRAPTIRISSSLVFLFGLGEELRSFILRKEPQVTRQSAMMTVRNYSYSTEKAQRVLNTRFRTIEESISWCCTQYSQNVSRNK